MVSANILNNPFHFLALALPFVLCLGFLTVVWPMTTKVPFCGMALFRVWQLLLLALANAAAIRFVAHRPWFAVHRSTPSEAAIEE